MLRWLLTPVLLPKQELSGRRLLLARSLAAMISLACLLMFTISLPARAAYLKRLVQQTSAVVSQAAVRDPQVLNAWVQALPNIGLLIEVAVMLLYFLTAMLLFRVRSDEWLVLFTIAGLSGFALHITPTLNTWMLAHPDLAIIGDIFKGFGIGFGLLFLYLFPSGYYAPTWMRVFLLIWVVWVILWLVNPVSIFGFRDPYTISVPGFIALMAWWGTGIFAQIYRYYRVSVPFERQQTKLITFGAAIVALAYLLYIPLREAMSRLPQPALAQALFAVTAPYVYLLLVGAIPITIAFSILRYRLWDIDLIIRRTIIYSALTVSLLGIYFLVGFLLQALVSEWFTRLPAYLLIATTIAVALLIDPLHRRIQAAIDRRFYRQKVDAERTLQAFNHDLEQLANLQELQERLAKVVQDTMQPESVGVWLRKTPDRTGKEPG